MFFGDFFGLFRENSVCFGCFDTGPKHRNKPKKIFFGFARVAEPEPAGAETFGWSRSRSWSRYTEVSAPAPGSRANLSSVFNHNSYRIGSKVDILSKKS